MDKIAIIELNELGLKLSILEVCDGGYYNVLDKISENIKLGSSVQNENIIPSAKINETITILKLFRKICVTYNVSKIYAFAKSFIKDAKNQISFFDEIYNNTSVSFTILNVEDEVKAIYSGVINFVDVPKGIIIDVEANKTHIIQYNRRTMVNVKTLPYGAVSLADQKIDYSGIIDMVKKDIKNVEFLHNLEEEVMFVGTGSTMISIGKLAKKVSHYPLDIDNNYVVQNEVFDAVFDKVKDLELDKTKKLKGISEDRADSLVSGMAIVKGISDAVKIEQFSISSGSFEQGLIHAFVLPEANDKPLCDMLTQSLDTIRLFYDGANSNTKNVYNLAIILFKQLKVIHKLPRVYIKALRIASSMYDCGKRINYDNYSNYSLDVIINSNLKGVSHKDLLLAGFACKYQNLDNIDLAEWVKYKDILTEEDLDAVRKLGVIVRLAAALDRSKSGNITDVSCDILGDSIIMKTIVKEDATFDIRQGMKVANDFKRVLKKSLQII